MVCRRCLCGLEITRSRYSICCGQVYFPSFHELRYVHFRQARQFDASSGTNKYGAPFGIDAILQFTFLATAVVCVARSKDPSEAFAAG
jgi:hypothetical protein